MAKVSEAFGRVGLKKIQGVDPLDWADSHGIVTWSKQKELLGLVAEHPRVAVQSAHSMGKSFTAALLTAWWLDSHRPGEAFVVTTAPTFAQVKAVLWKEIRRMKKKVTMPGRINLTEWHMRDELVALGRKPADWDPDAFQGIHAIYVLVIIDEASGVPDDIWEAADSLASNDNSKILAIGNPTINTGRFAQVCRPGSGWKVLHIDGLQSPNFTDEGKTLPWVIRESLLAPGWVRRKTEEWGGEETPPFLVRVRGMFPPDSGDDIVVPWEYLARCRSNEGRTMEQVLAEYPDANEMVELGVDIAASQKGDETVIWERRGAVAYRQWRLRSDKPEKVTQLILRAQQESAATTIKVDAIGWGWGVVGDVRSRLKEQGVRVVGINVAERSTKVKKFVNLRSQMWWEVGRELSQNMEWDLSLVDDPTLTQLRGPHYEYDNRMRIKVEPKADTIERIGRSPDSADALLLAFMPAPRRAHARARGGR